MPKIKKVKVTNGVYWVEAPQAQLYVLCGCPADSVKHLVKRGLIVSKEENDLAFESGPNAILLSDVLVQNGSFANLAEFPILQMLYRQGMLLPHHPNNTGAKPLLIGSRDQVKAQMQYLFRGNYGLASEEEILETGISPETAREMMGVKLHFAFGKIHPSEELLDSRIVEDQAVEIRNGVLLRRLGLNVFEFQYQGESVTVDLNLAPHEHYGAPYPLSFHNIRREYFAVIHAGEGDGWNSYRPCMASLLMFQGKIYLVDAGPNVLYSLKALGVGISEIEGIFHTHAHDDHFADLPALMRTDHCIKYYTTPLVRASVAKKLAALALIDEDDFADYFEIHDLEFDVWNELDGLEVKPLFSPHPVETNIFVFRALGHDGYHSYAHFGDIAADDILRRMVGGSTYSSGISQAFFDKIKSDYLQKVDVKKIDAGRELIHGNAEDFRHDPSGKIILSHVSAELSERQKEIGSGAPFGTIDVLIPAYRDYGQRAAWRFLHSYFTSLPPHELSVLLNNPLVSFNPETIILKSQVVPHEIYLVLTGNVEAIHAQQGIHSTLSAGALVGEISGLTKTPAPLTYRAANFVQALRLPCELYLEVVKRNGLLEDIRHLQDKRKFLKSTALFGEIVSYPVQNSLALAMRCLECPAGEMLSRGKEPALYVLQRGQMQRQLDQDVLGTLGAGDFFGEESVLFGIPALLHVRATQASTLYQIPGNVLLNIPIVRWKLLEAFEKRMSMILDTEMAKAPVFYWRRAYGINVRDMDRQHHCLFEQANKFYQALQAGNDQAALEEALEALIDYTDFHFSEEQALLKQHAYPDYKAHLKKHKRLVEQIIAFQEQFKHGEAQIGLELLGFLKSWIVNHVLTEDRKYAQFLNGKGVY
jgi:hemerythrin